MAKHTLTLADLAAQPWAIDPSVGHALAVQLAQAPMTMDSPDEPPLVYEYQYGYFPTATQPGSIAVLSIDYPMYDWYGQYLCNQLDRIYADPLMAGLLLKINTPGGSAAAGWRVADKLMQAPWPTAARIDYGMAASAGCLIGCACDGFYGGRPSDRVGSIGVYITWQDYTEYFKKLGIVVKDIYAEQSTEKNGEAKAAAKGDFGPIQAIATAEAARFIAFVKAQRPGLTDEHAYKGAMFEADQAVKIGLLSGIATQKEIISALRGTSTTLTLSTNRTTDMPFGYQKVAALTALVGLAAAELTDERIEAAQQELTAMGITNCTLVTQAQFEALATAPDPAALATAQAEVTRLTTELATEKTKATTASTELATAQAEVTRLGGLSGAVPTTATNANDTQADAGQNEPITLHYTAASAGISHLIDEE